MGKIKRYWTQLGYTKEQAAVNSDDFMKKTAPWSSITQCYMENIKDADISTIFPIHKSYFFNEPRMECTLLTSNHYNFKYNFARTHYLGFYFDHEFK